MASRMSSATNRKTRTISITSGKGGVGKTTLVCNLAHQLGKMGNKVLILDGDLGMANVDIFYGIKPKYNLYDVLSEKVSITEAIITVSENVSLIPGGSGVYELQHLSMEQRRALLDQVNELDRAYNYLIVDTAPGIDENVLYMNTAAEEIIVVLTPDPSSLADAYALIKVLNQRHDEKKFSVVCNMVRDDVEGMQIFKRLSDVAFRFLDVSLDFKGSIPMDPNLRKATQAQQIIVQANPFTSASLAITGLCRSFGHFSRDKEIKGGLQFFWQHLVGVA
jgi:flagellar biosynthesis protein FlhG